MRLRVFVFDDDEQIRSLLSIILEQRGYEVLSFPDPSYYPIDLDAECSCPEGYVCGDILITDNCMPNMTGIEFVQKIRNCYRGIAQNKAVISAAWAVVDLEQAKRLGCRIFQKPFSIKEITRWLDECEQRIDSNRKLIDLPDVSAPSKGTGNYNAAKTKVSISSSYGYRENVRIGLR